MDIRFVPYDQVDQHKWDRCIDQAENGLIYAYSVYLNTMSKHWDALVYGDYEVVMPLTGNRKYGIHYLYQPPFTACLGLFGNNLTAGLLESFFDAVPPAFRYWDICLNHGNLFSLKGYKLYDRMNYVLPLQAIYSNLYPQYRDNLKRNIKRSEQCGNRVTTAVTIPDAISLAKEQQPYSAISPDDLSRFERLCEIFRSKGHCKVYGVNNEAGQLVSACIFLFSHHRAYYLMPATDPNGKTSGASHALIDAFIRDHAGQYLLLDFEGSDISSLAFFYSSFGAMEERYPAIRLNRLPLWMRWIKK